MIRLAARLAVSGGRETAARLVLTALGVAVATTLLLLAAAIDPAIRAQQRHTAWRFSEGVPVDRPVDGDPLLWHLAEDVVDGHRLTVLRVAATGPASPVPLGLPAVPAPGEVHVSPPLADLLGELPADRLADRFPSAPSGTIDRDHLAGPDDLVAVVGTAPDELHGLGVLQVSEIRTEPAAFRFSDVLRVLVGIGVVGLLMPLLVFVATSARIGAARREERLAALRLAGATPAQTRVLAAAESGAAAAVGALLGAAGYAALRPVAAGIELDGHTSFVADVRVAPVVLVAVLLAVPALAVAAAVVSLRRLQVSPLGVVRRAPRPRPTARRLLPLAAGTVGFVASIELAAGSSGAGMLVPVMATFALMIYGIVAAGPWLTILAARLLRRPRAGASSLLAGRRLDADPVSGFRAVSGLVLAVFVASVFSGVNPSMMADNESGGDAFAPTTIVAMFPAGATSDRAGAALAAAVEAGGAPGAVLRVDPDPDRPLLDPAAGRGLTPLVACDDLGALAALDRDATCPAGGTAWIDLGADSPALEPAPYSAAEAAAMPAEAIAVPTDGEARTTDRVRTAIQRAHPGAVTRLASENEAEANRRLVQLNRVVNLALVLTLLIAGCGLAVGVAAGIIERKRPFALLRLAGMRLAELRRTALLEAAAPLLLTALATAALGLVTAVAVVDIAAEVPWVAPGLGYWLSLAGGLVVAVGAAAASLPLLARVTAPDAVRFE